MHDEKPCARPLQVHPFSSRDEQDLLWFCRQFEAAIGVRSTFGAMLAAASGVRYAPSDPAAGAPFVDALPDVARGKRIYRVLRRVEQDAAVVLLRHYELPRPGTDPVWGELAALVPMTPAAEDAREELAMKEGLAREASVRQHVARLPAEASEDFWRAAAALERVLKDIEQARAADDTERLRELEAPRKRARAAMKLALDACVDVPALPAVYSALASADHEVTVHAAIRHRLAKAASPEAKLKRADFIRRVLREAGGLLSRAQRAYGRAKESR